jgi:hypothetical protein
MRNEIAITLIVLTLLALVPAFGQIQSNDPHAILDAAERAVQAGNCPQAEPLFKRLLELVPDDPLAKRGLADCSAKSEKARLPYYISMIESTLAKEDFASALIYLEKALSSDAKHTDLSSYIPYFICSSRLIGSNQLNGCTQGKPDEAKKWLDTIRDHGGLTSAYDRFATNSYLAAINYYASDLASSKKILSALLNIEPAHPALKLKMNLKEPDLPLNYFRPYEANLRVGPISCERWEYAKNGKCDVDYYVDGAKTDFGHRDGIGEYLDDTHFQLFQNWRNGVLVEEYYLLRLSPGLHTVTRHTEYYDKHWGDSKRKIVDVTKSDYSIEIKALPPDCSIWIIDDKGARETTFENCFPSKLMGDSGANAWESAGLAAYVALKQEAKEVPSTAERSTLSQPSPIYPFSGSYPKSVISVQPAVATGRSNGRWPR